MFSMCESFFNEHRITISTNPDIQKSKTKCLIFSSDRNIEEPAPILLGDAPLPWVNSWPHLGHEISTGDLSRPYNGSLDEDAKAKLRKFIGKYYSLRQEFGFLQPEKFLDITVGSTERYSNVTQISVRQIFFLDKITEILVRQFFLNVSSK